MKLFVFGCGYTASHFLRGHGQLFSSIVATTRNAETALAEPGVKHMVFDGIHADEMVGEEIRASDMMLVSVPPGQAGDPVLSVYRQEIAAASRLRSIVYLSTIGVYGDHGGGWVNETTQPNPRAARSLERLAAESGWRTLAETSGKVLHVLRLAGIYGPGQNALENLRAGTARRLIKPGQVFNRIHVEDIARSIAAAFGHAAPGIWNVSDNEPAPPQDVIAFAAALLGIPAPQEELFTEAQLSPMARSFYGENKRVSNDRLKTLLGVELLYPTYREGITALAGSMPGTAE